VRTAPSTHWRSCIDVMQLYSCASVAGSLVCHIGVGLRAWFLSRPFSLATCPQPCSKCRTKCCRQAGEQWVTSSCRLREALSMSMTLLNILNCSCARSQVRRSALQAGGANTRLGQVASRCRVRASSCALLRQVRNRGMCHAPSTSVSGGASCAMGRTRPPTMCRRRNTETGRRIGGNT
jgi:hypothetical protein